MLCFDFVDFALLDSLMTGPLAVKPLGSFPLPLVLVVLVLVSPLPLECFQSQSPLVQSQPLEFSLLGSLFFY